MPKAQIKGRFFGHNYVCERGLAEPACTHEMPYNNSLTSNQRDILAIRAGSSAGDTWLPAFPPGSKLILGEETFNFVLGGSQKFLVLLQDLR